MECTETYDNCISLGWFCGTASSLSQLGLRSFSGPFDWCLSDFQAVVNQIDNEFADFLKKDNLEMVNKNPKVFRDRKYNFYYNHDVKENFENEYDNIYAKYTRRIERFIKKLKSPTCFFRAVRSEEEIRFIANNKADIENILKRYNDKNAIVYIVLNNMSSLPDSIRWFRLTLEQYIKKTYDMRIMFERSEELLYFCKGLLKTEQIELNRKYDVQKNGQKAAIAEIDYYVRNDINGIDTKILSMIKLQDNESFYIFGGGAIWYSPISLFD